MIQLLWSRTIHSIQLVALLVHPEYCTDIAILWRLDLIRLAFIPFITFLSLRLILLRIMRMQSFYSAMRSFFFFYLHWFLQLIFFFNCSMHWGNSPWRHSHQAHGSSFTRHPKFGAYSLRGAWFVWWNWRLSRVTGLRQRTRLRASFSGVSCTYSFFLFTLNSKLYLC